MSLRGKDPFQNALRGAGFRATPGRLAVLQALKKAEGPLSFREVRKRLSVRLDGVTVYRILRALLSAGLIRQVDFRHRHAHYEIADAADHHHVICTSCGKIEDFGGCDFNAIVQTALQKSRLFSRVTQHSLELFGICHACASEPSQGDK